MKKILRTLSFLNVLFLLTTFNSFAGFEGWSVLDRHGNEIVFEWNKYLSLSECGEVNAKAFAPVQLRRREILPASIAKLEKNISLLKQESGQEELIKEKEKIRRGLIKDLVYIPDNISGIEKVLEKEWNEAKWEEELEKLRKEGKGLYSLGAKINGKPVGFALFLYSLSNKCLYEDGELYLALLAIHPDFQGIGLSKKLIFSITEALTSVRKIFLETGSSEKNPAKKIYEHYNFKEYKEPRLAFDIDLGLGVSYVWFNPRNPMLYQSINMNFGDLKDFIREIDLRGCVVDEDDMQMVVQRLPRLRMIEK
jgi:ribosomal protein S18 acetylase RimI-like enzyme